MQYAPVRIQAAFFLVTIDMSSRINIASSVRECAAGLLDIDPVLLPFPPDSPPDFPQIIMQNEANGWNFQMAPGRFDIIANVKEPNTNTFIEIAATIQEMSARIFANFRENFGAKVNRLGLVSTNAAKVENAPEFLREKYLNANANSGAAESRLLFLHKYDVHSFSLNKWVRLISTVIPPRIILEIDINTRPDSPISVTEEVVGQFFASVNQLVDETIAEHS